MLHSEPLSIPTDIFGGAINISFGGGSLEIKSLEHTECIDFYEKSPFIVKCINIYIYIPVYLLIN